MSFTETQTVVALASYEMQNAFQHLHTEVVVSHLKTLLLDKYLFKDSVLLQDFFPPPLVGEREEK